MQIKILGTAAGGGLPQWNCNCPGCQAARTSAPGVSWLNQSSIAVRASDRPWFLVNASPDVRQQLELLREGKPESIRSSPIAGIVLSDAEIDHTTGLILLRESAQPLRLYGTDTVRRALTEGFPLLSTLAGYCGVEWSLLEPGRPINLGQGDAHGLEVEAFPLAAKPPKYMRHKVVADEVWVVGLTFRDFTSGKVVTYAPGLAQVDENILDRLESSDCILVDGTCWQDDELVNLGIAQRTARQMGHLPLSGSQGSIQHLAQLRRPRKILVHINNTNPILMPDSQERRIVEAAGIEVGYDGLTIEL
ncbi:MAG: Coenzyme PQQ synthesis protein B [Chroococcidiopsis sp. SAG 2025]|uniref:pyrroloquinoline quinone biosynthesis protein PqqB n=1 Tax=Chroococcidiopsis sp. SAG 2025 TaxID=171389 RepID=UPI00293713A8|nr:pyrroloquinoline quinone biosynthesis protein PqqB [Chroococcidiopsis sp. SAG 2025]MDV2993811.1 Coenzyme PQQ synthesis protein B [Chroococcidiopsis sp. SAG 2025]